MSVCSPGSLDDWDTAVQKTESRLNRVNQQRVKVRVGQAAHSAALNLAPPTVDSLRHCCRHRQAAEKEAVLAQQEGERAEQRRKARTEKKAAQKNTQKGAAAGEKRKAEDRWSHNSGRQRYFRSKHLTGHNYFVVL